MKKSTSEKKYVKPILFIKERYIYLSQTERLAFHVLFTIALVTTLALFLTWNTNHLVDSPRSGGTITEGIVGVPRFINPLYAERDVDRDLTNLIYSGLTRRTPQGNLIPDIAESWEISDDGTQYTFIIHEDAVFHDGTPVKATDVVFTIETIQDSTTKSPYERDWDGVIAQAINDETLIFTLSKPFVPFIQNTTLGILPSHIWGEVSPDDYLFNQYNLTPIGSGPYKIISTKRSPNETSRYSLKSFPDYRLGKPFIETVTLLFYDTDESLQKAYKTGAVSSGQFSSNLQRDIAFSETFALFFNQSKNDSIQDIDVREALYKLIDTNTLVKELLPNAAEPLVTYVPNKLIPQDHQTFSEIPDKSFDEILTDDGWEKDEQGIWRKKGEPLEFAIATADNQLLIEVGQYIVRDLESNGVKANLEIFSSDDFLDQVIRPRNFEVLLFGQQINHGLDLYGFWHSSQRNDPGLNITQYTNLDVNIYLEKLREESTPEEYQANLTNLLEDIEEDIPALPLFARTIPYTLPEEIFATVPNLIVYPSERLNALYKWHKEKDSLWKIFK